MGSICVVVEGANGNFISCEKYFGLDLDFGSMAGRLESVFGYSCQLMEIVHLSRDGLMKQRLFPNNQQICTQTLGQLGMGQYDRLCVSRLDGQVEVNLTKVQKYEMPTEKYRERDDSFYQWKQKNKTNFIERKELERDALEETNLKNKKCSQELIPRESNDLQIGQRCFVTGKGNPRTGTIRWIGNLGEEVKDDEIATSMQNEDLWIGVELDFAVGGHDGCYKGCRYFRTAPNSAVFTRPSFIQVNSPMQEDEDLEL